MKIKNLILSFTFLLALTGCAKAQTEIPKSNTETENSSQTEIVPRETETKSAEETETIVEIDKVDEIIKNMTIDEKIGQLVFARCPDVNAVADVETYNLGGYVLFARDFEFNTKEDVINNINSYQEASKIPMIIGVDEEGGYVNRVSKFQEFRSEPFKSPSELYNEGGLELIQLDTIEKNSLLKSLGINMNLAPVCDISTNSDDYIYGRTLGKEAEETATYIETVVSQMKTDNMGSVLKHFPGYGGNIDTHFGVGYDERTLDEFFARDFIPFIAGIENGANAVLVSHNVITTIDDSLPASLSPKVINVLKEDLNFQGVVMTDDLAMSGVQNFSETNTAVLAILAGVDMFITSDHKGDIEAIKMALASGQLTEERIDESVKKILTLKETLDLKVTRVEPNRPQ